MGPSRVPSVGLLALPANFNPPPSTIVQSIITFDAEITTKSGVGNNEPHHDISHRQKTPKVAAIITDIHDVRSVSGTCEVVLV